jgi:hypothetical protein
MPHNGTRIVAQPNPAANPAVPGGIGGNPRRPGTPYGRFILQTVAGTVRSGGNASTVRKP